jgi:general secretion pathway protein K
VAAAQPKVPTPPGEGGEGGQGGQGGQGQSQGQGQGQGGAGGQAGQGGQGGQGDTSNPGTPGASVSAAPVTTMKLLEVEDLLAIPGFNQVAVDKLRPFVIVLPEQTPVNVNTASAEVLSAVLPHMSVSEANALVARRKQAAWRDLASFMVQVNDPDLDNSVADVKSSYFLVDTRIRLDRAALNAESLVYRPLNTGMIMSLSNTAVKWTREY